MKTLHLSIIAILFIAVSLSINVVFAQYGQEAGNPIHERILQEQLDLARINKVEIQNIQVQPNIIKVNDTFSFNMTILNNSTFPIYLTSGSCTPAFSVMFDAHAKQVYPNIACTTEAILQKVEPQSQITISNANKPGIIYQAVQPGTATVNITISYFAKNQTATDYSNIYYNTSKSFQFLIQGANPDSLGPQIPTAGTVLPLQQFRSGVAAKDVKCTDNFILVIKAEDDSPACVKSDTATILRERGWATSIFGIPFTVQQTPENQSYTGTTTIGSHVYYFTTLNDTLSSYHGIAAIPFTFHNVDFTLFPSVFSAGPPGSCGDTNFGSEIKFSDGTYEKLGVHIPGSPCIENYTETELTNHKNPQAGLEDYNGKIRLLVNEENQTSSVESASCDMPYSPKTSYQSPLYSNGTVLHTDYMTVFYMPMNSAGKICVHYSNPNFQAPAGIDVFPANDLIKQANITTSANPSVIKTGNSTIVYTIKTGNMAGFYGIRLFCGGMPFAVGYDNQSRIVSSDFPWLGSTFYCPMLSYSFDITGLSGIGIYYITTVSHEQLDYDLTNTTVVSAHPNADIQNVTFSVHIHTFAKPANFWFDYQDSTISEFNSNPGFKQTTDPCNWEPAYHNSVGSFPWLGVTQINDNPVTIPPWSNGTYTFSILAKDLPSGYYGFNPVIYGKTTDLPPERAGTNYIAYDYPITIGVGHIMDPSGICSR